MIAKLDMVSLYKKGDRIVAKILKTAHRYRRLRRNEGLDHRGVRRLQEAKLQRLIAHAYGTVPYYRKLFDLAGVKPSSIQALEDLTRIPTTQKATLQEQEPSILISETYRQDELVPEHTSGSTGRPFTVWMDQDYAVTRNALFLRTLRAAGYTFGSKVLLITGQFPPKRKNRPLRWEYASIQQDSAHLLAILNRSKPDFLYGCVTPLRLLAEHVNACNAVFHKPKRILTTAESLDSATRTLLTETFQAMVFDFYGLTEMGPVGWECAAHQGYHLSEDTVIVEFLPVNGESLYKRMVMTNLDLLAMPLIRFEAGDMGSPLEDAPCACGRGFAKIDTVAGRVVDCVQLASGRIVTPYRLTCALETLPGIKRYQLVQYERERFSLRVEPNGLGGEFSDLEAENRLRPILGQEACIDIVRVPKFHQQPGVKFRVVETLLNKG
jgi:phenylacetate-CoA ligase